MQISWNNKKLDETQASAMVDEDGTSRQIYVQIGRISCLWEQLRSVFLDKVQEWILYHITA